VADDGVDTDVDVLPFEPEGVDADREALELELEMARQAESDARWQLQCAQDRVRAAREAVDDEGS